MKPEMLFVYAQRSTLLVLQQLVDDHRAFEILDAQTDLELQDFSNAVRAHLQHLEQPCNTSTRTSSAP